MKIASFGWNSGCLGQIQSINKGFEMLGHTISYDDPDLIYKNESLYSETIQFSYKWPRAKKIFNVLDIPHHSPGYPLNTLRQQLHECDYVTSISKNTQQDLLESFNIYSKVIYQPAKPVFPINGVGQKCWIMAVGRLNDSNKRIHILENFCKFIEKNGGYPKGLSRASIHVFGSENPNNGFTYHGIVDDNELNLWYNQTEYVYHGGKQEGIGLPLIEGIICNKNVLAFNDNPTNKEFVSEDILLDSNPQSIFKAMISWHWKSHMFKVIQDNSEKFKKQFSPIEVAQKIINIYQTL